MTKDFDACVALQEIRFVVSGIGVRSGRVGDDEQFRAWISLAEFLESVAVGFVDGRVVGFGEAVVFVEDYCSDVGGFGFLVFMAGFGG